MANMLDYIDWRGDITIDKSPFNDIDNLIFTQLCFIDFDGIVPGFEETGFVRLADAAEKFFQAHDPKEIEMGVLVPNDIVTLLKKMAEAPRFKDLNLTKYINKIDYENSYGYSDSNDDIPMLSLVKHKKRVLLKTGEMIEFKE